MVVGTLRFTAPRDFDKAVEKEYEAFMPVDWKESFYTPTKPEITIWVCDPSASFVINEGWLNYFPNLRILATPSTGENHLDRKAAEARGIKVISLLDDREGLETISASAEFTFKLLLDALRKEPARELQGKVVGLVGFGRIGHRLADWCQAFRAHWYAYDPYMVGINSWRVASDKRYLPTVFSEADAVIICCTYNAETKGMITADLLRSMKPGAALINTSRGEVIDAEGLYQVLKERPDIRFATDVVHGETAGWGEESRERLRSLGAIVTEHIAGATFDSRTKAAKIILELLKKEGV